MKKDQRTRINEFIRVPEVRLIGANGENIGVVSISEALKLAKEAALDLIEISPNAMPPVAKIMDYGKFQYTEKKKEKVAKAKVQTVEVKQIQVKIGTSEHDLDLKAKKASEWLAEGHRVKIELFLSGRAKYMEEKFLKERLDRVLQFISVPYRIAEETKRGLKGFTTIIERNHENK